MKEIDLNTLQVRVGHIWLKQWMILTAGVPDDFNAMTVGWGGLGVMWNKPFVQVVVRPGRHTFQFMEKYPTFTLCAFPESYRKALTVMGTKSGRDCDKVRESGLTPMAGKTVDAPVYREAELILECRKIYWQEMDSARFLDASIQDNYPNGDYHRIYYGQIVHAEGADAYQG